MMKHIKLYENFEDFDETWIDDESSLEIDISNIKLGKDGPEFNVLDKVKVFSADYILNHEIGYIINYNYSYAVDLDLYLIYFINYVGEHDGRHCCNIPDGHGLWVPAKNLKKV